MRHDDDVARAGVDSDASWMLTASGAKLYFLKPTADALNLADIAYHTSNICRFTGAVSQFYSVAQHSVFVGQLVKQMLDSEITVEQESVEYWDQILAGLLHDSEEAYVQDLVGPLKACIRGKYKWVATGIRRKIFEKYNIDWEYHNATVKAADNKAIIVERYHLMPDHPDWPKLPPEEMPYPKPNAMMPISANNLFSSALQYALQQRTAHSAEAGPEAL